MRIQVAVVMTDREERRMRRIKKRIARAMRDSLKVVCNAVIAFAIMIFIANVLLFDSCTYWRELAGALIVSIFAAGIAAGIKELI